MSFFAIVFYKCNKKLALIQTVYSQERGQNLVPRRGENIHKRKDGRWEARYI